MYDEDRLNSELDTAKREGRKEGVEEGVRKTAKNLKQLGVSVDIIAQSTGLPLEIIETL